MMHVIYSGSQSYCGTSRLGFTADTFQPLPKDWTRDTVKEKQECGDLCPHCAKAMLSN